MQLAPNTKLTLAKAAQSSAGTAVESDAIDMANFQGVTFHGTIATGDAGNFAKVQQSEDGSTGWADLKGSRQTIATNGEAFIVDVRNPEERHVRCVVIRAGTNTATGDIYATQYGAAKAPTTDGTGVNRVAIVSPDEGTA